MNTISVITPVYNGERYIADAIRSILAQTIPVSEIIVIDDGSADRSAEIARAFPAVRCVSIDHAGVGAARNHGVRMATGSFLTFLDADDIWLPQAMESLLASLCAEPNLDAVFGGIEHFFSDDCPDEIRRRFFVQDEQGAGKLCGAMLVRAESFRRAGAFDEFGLADFVGWYLRAQEASLRMSSIATTVLRRRIHGENATIRAQAAVREDYLALIRTSLARRRGTSGGRA